uniref:Uncharacterized protein LOC114337614 isoform X1 n=1 Tax=Diabrotica virgifera virgifera TaxID=50390 RepID=A0A6P7G4N4_DIAVI
MFGKPPKIDETIKFCNRLAIVATIFFFQCVFLYEAAALYGSRSCLKIAEEKGLHINCLTMFPVWLPFEADVSTQLIISFVQFMLILYCVIPVGAACLLPWEVSQQLTIHIHHLNNMFNNIFETDNKEEQRRRLSIWIKYNLRIIRITCKLNRLTKGCVGIVSLVVSIVLALTANQLMSWNRPLAAFMHISGWLCSLTANCITGQQIINQTQCITKNIVCSKWYTADLRVKKDILFVLLNSQRSFRLSALPFGTLNMELLLLIIKSSYSYMTLLKNVT